VVVVGVVVNIISGFVLQQNGRGSPQPSSWRHCW
jgi:hypothetical protein